jgi:hypothetical protein
VAHSGATSRCRRDRRVPNLVLWLPRTAAVDGPANQPPFPPCYSRRIRARQPTARGVPRCCPLAVPRDRPGHLMRLPPPPPPPPPLPPPHTRRHRRHRLMRYHHHHHSHSYHTTTATVPLPGHQLVTCPRRGRDLGCFSTPRYGTCGPGAGRSGTPGRQCPGLVSPKGATGWRPRTPCVRHGLTASRFRCGQPVLLALFVSRPAPTPKFPQRPDEGPRGPGQGERALLFAA